MLNKDDSARNNFKLYTKDCFAQDIIVQNEVIAMHKRHFSFLSGF